jgi:putative NADH-flavin reductase
MNIVIFGASRGVGRCLTQLALDHGHEVTAAARDPAAMRLTHQRLRVLRCDVLDASAVGQALRGQHVAFCTLGGPRRGVTLYSEGARNVVAGMREQKVRRLVFLSNFGVLGERPVDIKTAALVFLAKLYLRDTLADHRRALEVIRQHAPEWVAVRPMALTDAPGTGRYRIAVAGLPANGSRIARADVADFMLRSAASDEYLCEVPAIAY